MKFTRKPEEIDAIRVEEGYNKKPLSLMAMPKWMLDAIEKGQVTFHASGGMVSRSEPYYSVVSAMTFGAELYEAYFLDWIVRESHGHLRVYTEEDMNELFERSAD